MKSRENITLLLEKWKNSSEVSIGNNKDCKENIDLIVGCLSENHNLVNLDLSGNNLGNASICTIVEALKNSSILTSINLSNNKIGLDGVKNLVSLLSVNSSLQNINLTKNNIGSKSVAAISEVLIDNKTLTSLNLKKNNIGREAAFNIAKILKNNKTLTELDLSGNSFGAEGIKTIYEGLKKNYYLRKIGIYDKEIDSIIKQNDKFMAEFCNKLEISDRLELKFKNPALKPLKYLTYCNKTLLFEKLQQQEIFAAIHMKDFISFLDTYVNTRYLVDNFSKLIGVRKTLEVQSELKYGNCYYDYLPCDIKLDVLRFAGYDFGTYYFQRYKICVAQSGRIPKLSYFEDKDYYEIAVFQSMGVKKKTEYDVSTRIGKNISMFGNSNSQDTFTLNPKIILLPEPIQALQDIKIRAIRKNLEDFKDNQSIDALKEAIQESGSDIKDHYVYSVLLSAAIVLEDIEVVKKILSNSNLNILTQPDGTGYSPIARTLWRGNEQIFSAVRDYIEDHKDYFEFKRTSCTEEDQIKIFNAMRFPKLKEMNSKEAYMKILEPLYDDTKQFEELLNSFWSNECDYNFYSEDNNSSIELIGSFDIDQSNTGEVTNEGW